MLIVISGNEISGCRDPVRPQTFLRSFFVQPQGYYFGGGTQMWKTPLIKERWQKAGLVLLIEVFSDIEYADSVIGSFFKTEQGIAQTSWIFCYD